MGVPSEQSLCDAEEVNLLPSGCWLRVAGRLEPFEPDGELRALGEELAARQQESAALAAVDGSCTYRGVRWRYSVFATRDGTAVVLRRLPSVVPTLESLGFGDGEEILSLVRGPGLVLFAGPTGAGKTTTQAAVVATLIGEANIKVVTVEEPIEYVHESPLVLHREVGAHVASFAAGVREAMRQTPDLIVVGEVRERDAAEAAVKAGISGHRVFATIHASDIEEAIGRMWSFLDDAHDELLPEALAGVVVQHIARSGALSAPVYETIEVTPQVRGELRIGPKGLTHISQECYMQRRKRLPERARTLVSRAVLPASALERWCGG